jgi:hypothetical protein
MGGEVTHTQWFVVYLAGWLTIAGLTAWLLSLVFRRPARPPVPPVRHHVRLVPTPFDWALWEQELSA